jgi:threonine dehydrogenase-like Zn-dependent dehydrogenase
MRAVVCAGGGRVRLDDVPQPRVEAPPDAIVKVTRSSICGSDLHLLDGKTPGVRLGAVIGHEFTGIVHDPGPASGLGEGQRVLGSFLIACGECSPCRSVRYNHCRRRRALGLGELTGDLGGAQAEYVRVPNARLNLKPLDAYHLDDERALFCGDILAAGFQGTSLAAVPPGGVVAVIGAGPVGLCCALAAKLRMPGRLIVLDTDAKRVAFAREQLSLEAIDVSETDPQEAVAEATAGEMADSVVEAVGATGAFKAAMMCARDGGRVVVLGVYGRERYDLPMGVSWVRGLQIVFAGMANVQGCWDEALDAVASGDVDPTRLITHRLALDEAEKGYDLFRTRRAVKVVLIP